MKRACFFVTAILLFSGVFLTSINNLNAQNCWATGYDPANWSFAWNCSGLGGTCGQNPTNPVTGAGNFYYDLSPKDVSGGVSHGQSNAMWYKATKDFAVAFTISWEFRFRKDANNAGPYPPTAQDNYNDGYQLVFAGVPTGNVAPTATEACWGGQSGGAIGGFWYNGSNVVTGTQSCGSGQITVGHVLVIQFDMVDNKLSGNTDVTEPGIQEHLGIGHSNGGQPIHTFNFCPPVTIKPGAFTYPGSSVRDGNWHSVSVTWTPVGANGGNFTVVVDGNTRMTGCSVPASVGSDIRQAFNFWSPGTKTTMWGFTGAAGPDATIANADDVHIRFPCIVAPVNLLNFDATLQENKTVLLNWRTAREQNNAYFIVERSEDGIHYESIGKMEGKNSNEISEYSFIDFEEGGGIHYYRLKQVDLDGKIEYSEWTRVVGNKEEPVQQTIQVYPNPGNGIFTVEVLGFDEDLIEVELYNLLGEVLYKRTQKLEGPINTIDVNISNQPEGIYFIKLSDGKNIYTEQFVKE